MIKILENKKSKKKRNPYYELVIHYMIGDADGDTSKENVISMDNEYIERFMKLINNLPERPGHWGISLDQSYLDDVHSKKLMSDDDYKFLSDIFGYPDESKFTHKQLEYIEEISECIASDTEYSFLTIEYAELVYYNEYGEKFNTQIVD